jgi:hypothetical protein
MSAPRRVTNRKRRIRLQISRSLIGPADIYADDRPVARHCCAKIAVNLKNEDSFVGRFADL